MVPLLSIVASPFVAVTSVGEAGISSYYGKIVTAPKREMDVYVGSINV